jgi:hypothetical protein
MSYRAALIREAQQMGAQHSSTIEHLLESLVREVTLTNANRVIELVRQLDGESGQPPPQKEQPEGR